ncbi:MAG: hypothetical protein KF852_06120 [Saprospiraceae bacterium]|nr:hypothetical protein [Saprospiraceae bacterium]
MKNSMSRMLLLLLCSASSLAFKADTIILPRGTTIYVELWNEENGEELDVGYVVSFKVRDEVRVNNFPLIVTNAPAEGEVIRASFDEVQIEVRTVKAVDGKVINVRGRLSAKRPCRKCPLTLKKATGIMTTVLDDVKIQY